MRAQRSRTRTAQTGRRRSPKRKETAGGDSAEKSTEPAGAAAGSQAEAVSAEATGLHPGATYTFCPPARNASGQEAAPLGVPEQLTAGAAVPAIESAGSSHETASSAELEAAINPDGAETEYHFEYDTRAYAEGEAPHGTSVPCPGRGDPRRSLGRLARAPADRPAERKHDLSLACRGGNTAGKTATPSIPSSMTRWCRLHQLPRGSRPPGTRLPEPPRLPRL